MTADGPALVQRFRRNRDEASFRALYAAHTPMIFALAVRLTDSRPQAEELTQETWLRAVEGIARFDGRSRFSTWLTGILLNCHRETHRGHAQPPHADDRLIETAGVVEPLPVAAYPSADPMDLERALAQLAPGYREILILHDLHGYKHAEIASMLGVQEGTSKSQLVRARASMRSLLSKALPSAADHENRGAP